MIFGEVDNTDTYTQVALYEQFARIAKALANRHRIELLELLDQTPREVESLARAANMSMTTTSSHLQVLRQARLVASHRQGTKIIYRLSGEDVAKCLASLRQLASTHLAEVKEILTEVFNSDDRTILVSHDELLQLIENDDAVIIDVRPVEEYVAAHIKGALSMPLETINEQLVNLDKDKEIVAYCRGPHCVLAPQAMEILRSHGFHVRRLIDGLPEWRMANLPVSLGAQP